MRRLELLIPAAVLTLVVLAVLFAPLLAPHQPLEQNLDDVLGSPSAQHWFGTDSLGRDILSRMLYGGRVSLSSAAIALAVFVALGVPLGLWAGFTSGPADRTITWLADLLLALPTVIILLVVLAVFKDNEVVTMVALGVTGSTSMIRVVRGATKAVRGQVFVVSAEGAGLNQWHILRRHVLPHVRGPITVQATFFAATAVLVETSLGFLGLGVQAPRPTWGNLVGESIQQIQPAPWFLLITGGVVALVALCVGLVGDAIRDMTATEPDLPSPSRPARARPGTASTSPSSGVLALENVTVCHGGVTPLVTDVSFALRAGEVVGLVGESGCGKSMTARAALGLLPDGVELVSGVVRVDGADVAVLSSAARRRLLGRLIGYVPQDPVPSLDPSFTVGSQLAEVVATEPGLSRAEVRERCADLLRRVRVPDVPRVLASYPHQISGGMAQRVNIALAMALRPRILIADEPTTALDVTVQAEILDLLRTLAAEQDLAVLLVTHDWGVVADLCERAVVMYAGEVVEISPVATLFARPSHPYTRALLRADLRGSTPFSQLPTIPGVVPAAGAWAYGCRFADRCVLAADECRAGPVPLRSTPDGVARCVRSDELQKAGVR
ncbi:dipeptide/oligopeptide/nickel ABC transporter permease/ATP-binding protein [Microtetraspora fusca]|uniref:Dipeptide/oligopeptide/nickel ABC transporter permease/ATP-binding protein n=1 Tax=Microtetraspora fusca TaxID=1997 RepID=A0ABW6VIP7_MICFU